MCLHTIVTDKKNPKDIKIAISTGGVYQSADGGDSWKVTMSGVTAAGDSQSETRTLVPGTDRVEVLVSNRNVGGESLPDLEFTMVRRPPVPASRAAAQAPAAE